MKYYLELDNRIFYNQLSYLYDVVWLFCGLHECAWFGKHNEAEALAVSRDRVHLQCHLGHLAELFKIAFHILLGCLFGEASDEQLAVVVGYGRSVRHFERFQKLINNNFF